MFRESSDNRTDGEVMASCVPEWSGEFIEVGMGVGIMRVHNADTRQHFPPPGWRATGHDTFPDGTLEVYTYQKVGM